MRKVRLTDGLGVIPNCGYCVPLLSAYLLRDSEKYRKQYCVLCTLDLGRSIFACGDHNGQLQIRYDEDPLAAFSDCRCPSDFAALPIDAPGPPLIAIRNLFIRERE